MATELDVYNGALGELGAAPLTSTSDASINGNRCRTHYAAARDMALEMHPWHFATVYTTLQQSANTPAFRWQYQYSLPTTPYCLIVQMTDKGEGTRWELGYHPTDGRILFSNEPAVKIAYTARIEDLTLWTPMAIQVLIKLLASKLAKAITGQTAVEDEKRREALALVQLAQQQQVRESGGGPLQVIPSQDLTLQLYNEALGELGLPAMADPFETTIEGEHLRRQYVAALDATLELAEWPFARMQAALTLSTFTPVFKWPYQYRLPTDPYCLTVLATDQGSGADWEIGQHAVEGRVLLTSASSVQIEYIGRVTDLSQWNGLGRQVLVKMLAAKVAQALAAQGVAAIANAAQGPQTYTSLAQTKYAEALQLVPMAVHHHASELAQSRYRTTNEGAASSPTLIAQRAMGELGVDPLTDIDELTVQAWHCRMQLTAARQALLEMHPWNFATRQATLTQVTTPPLSQLPTIPGHWAPNWQTAFSLPADALFVLATDEGNGAQWAIGQGPDGRLLYSNQAAVTITYIADVTDYGLWNSLAREALVKLLASKIAPFLAQERSDQAQNMPSTVQPFLQREAQGIVTMGLRKYEEFQAVLKDARERDGREGSPDVLRPNTTLVSVRGRRQGALSGWPTRR